jgi:hypothetical protein
MHRILPAAVTLLALAPLVSAERTQEGPVPAQVACPVTLPNGIGIAGNMEPGVYGNGQLSVGVWTDGTILFTPGGPGFTLDDGSMGTKIGWRRGVRGRLQIEGRRLDAPAPPLRAWISDGYGDVGRQPVYLIFPTPGCWEVTGRVGDATLTYVTRVVRIGEGPSRWDAPEPAPPGA